MQDVVIRPFRIEDLNEIVALQNLCMPQDAFTSAIFQRKVLLDANLDLRGCLVAEVAKKPVGFILGMRRRFVIEDSPDDSDRGWITLFFVHPDYRKQGIGAKLLETCEGFLRSEGRKTVWIASYAPNYFIPGVDLDAHADAHKFLLDKGYTELMRPLAMDSSLVQLKTPEWVQQRENERIAEGYRFQFFTEEYTFKLLDHMKKCFPGDWQRYAREKMTGITLMRNLPDELAIAINKDDEVVGFAQHEGERFGPFGVDETLRGKGIGAVLLFMILHRMRAKAFHTAWFLWTDDKVAQLYAVGDFAETRRFALLKKPL